MSALRFLGNCIGLISRILGSDAEALATLTYRNGEAIVLSLTIVILGMQVLVGLGKELVDHLTVFANIASGGITLIKVFVVLDALEIFDDILPASKVEPLFLLVDELQSPLTLYIVERYSGEVVSVVAKWRGCERCRHRHADESG